MKRLPERHYQVGFDKIGRFLLYLNRVNQLALPLNSNKSIRKLKLPVKIEIFV